MYANNRAFSLLELLITLMIIAILTGIALPSYRASLIHSHRMDGKVGLYHLAAQLEKLDEAQKTGSQTFLTQSPQGFYKLGIVKKSAGYFLLAAFPEKSQVDDKTCGVLALDSLGNKGVLRGEQIILNKQCF